MKRRHVSPLAALLWITLAFLYGFFNGWMARGHYDWEKVYETAGGAK